MKTFIIAAVSADGFIAKDTQHSPMYWTSKADKKRFVELTKKAGVVVMGSATYKTIGAPLKERVTIVYSKSQTFPDVEVTQKSPIELINELEGRGFKEVAICGGSQIYTMFLKAGVVDTVYLTVEPILFGKGISIFNDDLKYHLKLESALTSTASGSVLIEYKVDKSGTPQLQE